MGAAAQQSGGSTPFPLHDFWQNSESKRVSQRVDDALLVADYLEVPIVIEGVSGAANGLGLTGQRLWNRVELHLREAGLVPAEVPPGDDPEYRFLHVQISLDDSLFVANVGFSRTVYFDHDGVAYARTADV